MGREETSDGYVTLGMHITRWRLCRIATIYRHRQKPPGAGLDDRFTTWWLHLAGLGGAGLGIKLPTKLQEWLDRG